MLTQQRMLVNHIIIVGLSGLLLIYCTNDLCNMLVLLFLDCSNITRFNYMFVRIDDIA